MSSCFKLKSLTPSFVMHFLFYFLLTFSEPDLLPVCEIVHQVIVSLHVFNSPCLCCPVLSLSLVQRQVSVKFLSSLNLLFVKCRTVQEVVALKSGHPPVTQSGHALIYALDG